MFHVRPVVIGFGAFLMLLGFVLSVAWRDNPSTEATRVISVLLSIGGLCLFFGIFIH